MIMKIFMNIFRKSGVNRDMKYYLIYGLKCDFTYLEEFETIEDLEKYLFTYVINNDNYESDYKIIKGNQIELGD